MSLGKEATVVLGDLGVGSADLEMWANMGRVGIRLGRGGAWKSQGRRTGRTGRLWLQTRTWGCWGIVCIRGPPSVHKPSLPTGEVLAQAHHFCLSQPLSGLQACVFRLSIHYSEVPSDWGPGSRILPLA